MGTMPLYITFFYIFLISGGFTLIVERAEKEEEHNLTFADVPELLTGLSSTGLAAFSILFNKTAEKFRSLRKEQSNLVIRNMDNRTVAEVVEEVKGTAEPSKPIKEEKDFQISTANRIEEGTVDTVTKGTGRSPISTSQMPKTEKQDIKIVVINNANAETVKQIVEGLEKSVDATGEESNEKETDIRIVIINNSHMETVSTTQPPTTEPSTTQPPTTEPPTTQPPSTEPSTTQSPTTEPLTTEPSTTQPPTTELPTTEPPTSKPKDQKVILYEDTEYEGKSLETFIGEHSCRNVKSWMDNKASSIKMEGKCVILCDERDCQGRCVKVSSEGGSGYCTDLSDLSYSCGFNDMTSSIKPC